MKKRITAAMAALVFALVSFSGCAKVESENLTDGIKNNPVPVYNRIDEGQNMAVAQFSAKLLQQLSADRENVVYSPLSVLYALAMTANGADGDTLLQMEEVMGMSSEELNSYLHSAVNLLPGDEGRDFDIANSIWIKDDEGKFIANEEFLQTVKDYYLADIYKASFDDGTLKDINNWVAQKTNGQIQDILDKIDRDAVMYLINAINFEALWQNEYEEHQIETMAFCPDSGKLQQVEFMFATENGYLEDENTTGFIKYYKGREYAYVALLPQKDIPLKEYIATLNGEKLTKLLENTDYTQKVETAIPKYETTFDVEMSEIFKNLGMTDAFDYRTADFSRMGQPQAEGENICINRILHKAFIRVAEQGTQAGAATVVEMVAEGAIMEEKEPKKVWLDRPFVYMIIDTQNNLPLFMGAVHTME